MEKKYYLIGANVVEKDKKFILVQESFEEAKGKWHLPGGKLEQREDIITCAKREGEEETGFRLQPSYLIGIYQYYTTTKANVIIFVFKSEIIGGELTVPKDLLDVKWLSSDEIKGFNQNGILRKGYVLEAIQDYQSGKRVSFDFINILD